MGADSETSSASDKEKSFRLCSRFSPTKEENILTHKKPIISILLTGGGNFKINFVV
jgi:hypothetical protein